MKVLLIQPNNLEESLMLTPVIRSLKTDLETELHVLTKSDVAHLLKENPYIDHLITFNQRTRLKSDLKGTKYDYVFDYQNSIKTKFLRFRLGKKTLAFKNETFKQWIYCKTKINLLSKKHLIERYFELLNALTVKSDHLGLDIYIPDKDEVEKEWLPKSHQNGYAIVTIGANHFTKKLPVNRLIELCDRINKPIILIGEQDDLDVANEIEEFFKRGTSLEEKEIEELNKKAVIFNACGKFNFYQQASLIKQSNWVFTHENIWMHVAGALKKKIYSIWGNTTPLFGRYPYMSSFTIFENNKLSCRPCSPTGFSNCPKGHFKCMNDVTFDFYLPD